MLSLVQVVAKIVFLIETTIINGLLVVILVYLSLNPYYLANVFKGDIKGTLICLHDKNEITKTLLFEYIKTDYLKPKHSDNM